MMKKIGWFSLAILILLSFQVANTSADDGEKITVYNPRGIQPPIRLIPMPERGSIEGKTVYLVDTKYPNTKPFANELFKILNERYPKTNWVFKEKRGMYMDDDPDLWAEIKEKAQAMIMVIGHWSTCTPAVVGHCVTVERIGVPTAPIVTGRFVELASTTALKKGIPNLRINYTPHPITDQPEEMCRKFLEGNDANTGKPLLDGVIASITKPLSKEEKKRGFLKREPRPKFLPADTEDNLQSYFMENNFTDGGPVILPTKERVARMLEGTSHAPDEIVGTMRPSPPHEAWEYTVEMVAVNAVMAGAKAEYFPVILALASTGTSSLFSSTSSFARMVVVNGPIIEEIGMNPGIGAMGPFNRANTTIGRAWTLISKNLGGSGKPGETFLGTLGNPLSYNNMCFPENEEALPEGWKPFHVQKGFKESDSVVSVFSGWSYNNIAWYSKLRNQDVIKNWLTHFFSFGTGAATLMIDPVTLGYIYGDGFDTKEKLASYLAKNSGTPAWLYWQRRERQIEMGKAGTEPFASYLKMGENAVIPESRYVRTPQRTETNNDFFPEESGRAFLRDTVEVENSLEILVVGGGTNTYWGGGDFSYMSSANVDKWR